MAPSTWGASDVKDPRKNADIIPHLHMVMGKSDLRNWRSPNHAGLSLGFCASRERSYCRAEIVPQHPSKSTDGSKHSIHRALSAWKPEDLTWTTKTTTGFGNFFRVRMFRCLKSYCSYQKHFALQPTEYRALSPKRHDLSHKRRSSLGFQRICSKMCHLLLVILSFWMLESRKMNTLS